ncbi:hypothetical protein CerSpe_145370 [Prunus speciosa]
MLMQGAPQAYGMGGGIKYDGWQGNSLLLPFCQSIIYFSGLSAFLCLDKHLCLCLTERNHLNHHFRIQSKGFGVTSSLWDTVFGTLPSTKEKLPMQKTSN